MSVGWGDYKMGGWVGCSVGPRISEALWVLWWDSEEDRTRPSSHQSIIIIRSHGGGAGGRRIGGRLSGWGSVRADLCGHLAVCRLTGGLDEHGLCQLLSCRHGDLLDLIQLL